MKALKYFPFFMNLFLFGPNQHGLSLSSGTSLILQTTLLSFLLLIVGKQRRLQFVECANDINAMIDAAKFADLVLLLTDGSYGFEMVCSSSQPKSFFCC